MKLLIKKGRIIDPINELDMVGDILIEDGRIKEVGENIEASEAKVIQAEGYIVSPGLMDMHVHLREPGYEAQEDIESGTAAAACGGFTKVACMPNTDPAADNAAVVRAILSRAQQVGSCRVLPIGCISKGQMGKELAEIGCMVEAGIVAVSDDGKPVADSSLMRKAMQYAEAFDIPVISHCEDPYLSSGGVVNEGLISTKLGLKGIPNAAEEIMVARDIILAELTGARLHIAHVSTAGSVRLIREAKKRGVKVTCEAAPHHFTLTDECVKGYDTNTKVNPPLRTIKDVEAVIEGLVDGTIDVIASDHAPHTVEAKSLEYDYAPFGISGLETMVPLIVSGLIDKGILSWMEALKKLTKAPADILKVPLSGIAEGSSAEITVIDPNNSRIVEPASFKSKGKNTPFKGMELKGWPVLTICGGKITHSSLDL